MAQVTMLPEATELAIVDSTELLKQNPGPEPKVDPETNAPTVLRPMVIKKDPKVTLLPGLLTGWECRHIIQLADGHWSRSLVGKKGDGSGADGRPAGEFAKHGLVSQEANTRTSTSCMLRSAQTEIVARIERRIASVCQVPLAQLEQLVVVKYNPGEHFTVHHDGRFRPMTLFVYLNELPEGDDGGDTYFPHLGLSIIPREGSGVMWPNVLDGKEDSRLVHAGRPPKLGVKYGVNCFFHDSVVRIADLPSFEVHAEDAFVVDFATLGGSPAVSDGAPDAEPTGDSDSPRVDCLNNTKTFVIKTEPRLSAIPSFASDSEMEALDSLLGAACSYPSKDPEVFVSNVDPSVAAESDLNGLEVRLANAVQFPPENMAPLRFVRGVQEPGLCNRGCGQRMAWLCMSPKDEVFFPHLGVVCRMKRGDLLMWPNTERMAVVGKDGKELSLGADSGQPRRVVEDLRTLRVHSRVGEQRTVGVEVSFSDGQVRSVSTP